MEFSSEYIQQSDSVDFYVCVYWYLVVHVAICIIICGYCLPKMNIFTILLIVIKNQHDLTGFDTVKTAFADLCKPILVQEVIESIIKGVH